MKTLITVLLFLCFGVGLFAQFPNHKIWHHHYSIVDASIRPHSLHPYPSNRYVLYGMFDYGRPSNYSAPYAVVVDSEGNKLREIEFSSPYKRFFHYGLHVLPNGYFLNAVKFGCNGISNALKVV